MHGLISYQYSTFNQQQRFYEDEQKSKETV